jgi:hypothetical protein
VPHGIFQKIQGIKGECRIPTLGALIGTMSQWTLTRREGEDGASDGDGLYDLRAVFSYLNPHLWEDEDYAKEIVVTLGRTKQFRVHKANGEETVLVGRSLLMKGVSISEYSNEGS